MSTDTEARRALKGQRYGREQRPIPLVLSMRDLGSHLVSCRRAGGATLTARLRTACKTADAVAALPVSRETKAILVATKVNAAALYGAASAPASNQALQALRARASRALDPGALRNNAKEA
eukprot:3527796-Alexandrium_andersonii.AAC.1